MSLQPQPLSRVAENELRFRGFRSEINTANNGLTIRQVGTGWSRAFPTFQDFNRWVAAGYPLGDGFSVFQGRLAKIGYHITKESEGGVMIENSNGMNGHRFHNLPDLEAFIIEQERKPRETVEEEILRKGLTAPRITPEAVEKSIVLEQYHVFPVSTVTVCCLTLVNGFTVVGESACADPRNFDEAIGRRVARDDAKRKIWALLGYGLREELYRRELGGGNSASSS